MPLLPDGGVALVLSLRPWGLAVVRQAEERRRRVGSPKDPADELGTRPSSISAWADCSRCPAARPPSGACVVENLSANSLSALDQRPGIIEVALAPGKNGRGVEVMVRDKGRGMTPREQRRAFEVGYTTKRRGWGLGLALARRGVQEYHGG